LPHAILAMPDGVFKANRIRITFFSIELLAPAKIGI